MSHRDTKVYVGNLSSSTTRGDLEYEFENYGRLANVWVAKSPPGFAYVEFDDYRDAEDAIKGLDGRELHGRRIRVEWSHGGPRGGREFGDRGRERDRGSRRSFHPNDRCYNCGETGHYAYDCDLYHRRSSRGGSDRRRSRRSNSRSRSRSRSRSHKRRRSRSYSRSKSRSPRRRSASRSRSRSPKSRSRSKSRDRRSRSDSRGRKSGSEKRSRVNGDGANKQSVSKSRSRSRS